MKTVTINASTLSFKTPLTCVLTGEPDATVQPFMLRRMYFLLALWIGESIAIPLPQCRVKSYVWYQHLRTFRWLICAITPIPIVSFIALPIDKQWVKGYVFLAIAIFTWWALGRILRGEKIRLKKCHGDRQTCDILFTDDDMHKRFVEMIAVDNSAR